MTKPSSTSWTRPRSKWTIKPSLTNTSRSTVQYLLQYKQKKLKLTLLRMKKKKKKELTPTLMQQDWRKSGRFLMMKKIIQFKKNNPRLMNFSKMMTNPMKLMFQLMMMYHLMMIIQMKMMKLMAMMIKSKLKSQSPSFCSFPFTNTGRRDGQENLINETLRKFYKQAKPFKFSNFIL